MPLIAGGSAVGQGGCAGVMGAGALCVSASGRPVGAAEPCRNELPCRRGLPGTGCRLRKPPSCGAAALRTMENRHSATAWEENVKRMGCRMGT